MKHEISLDDTSVREMKYFIANDDTDVPGKPIMIVITIDFDESEEMSFLAMQIEPDDKNGLSQFKNAYQPSASKDVSLSSANRRYIAIEFRSDSEFRDLLRTMKMDITLQAFIDESSRLTSDNAESYGGSLLESARKERKARESSLGLPRARRTRTKKRGSKVSNDIMLVFPFGADEDKIDEAADGFDEAMQQITLASSRHQDAAEGAAALNRLMMMTTRQQPQLIAAILVRTSSEILLERPNLVHIFLRFVKKIMIDCSLESFSMILS